MRKTSIIIALLLATMLTQAQDDIPTGGQLESNNQLSDMLENGESGILTIDPGAIFEPSDPGDPGDAIGLDSPGDLENGDAPVDGGLSLLLAAGAAYGARRLRRARGEKEQTEEP